MIGHKRQQRAKKVDAKTCNKKSSNLLVLAFFFVLKAPSTLIPFSHMNGPTVAFQLHSLSWVMIAHAIYSHLLE